MKGDGVDVGAPFALAPARPPLPNPPPFAGASKDGGAPLAAPWAPPPALVGGAPAALPNAKQLPVRPSGTVLLAKHVGAKGLGVAAPPAP